MVVRFALAILLYFSTINFATSEIIELFCEDEFWFDVPDDEKAVMLDKLDAEFNRIIRLDTARNLVEMEHSEPHLNKWISMNVSDTELSWEYIFYPQLLFNDKEQNKIVRRKAFLNRFSGKLITRASWITNEDNEFNHTITEICSVKKKMF